MDILQTPVRSLAYQDIAKEIKKVYDEVMRSRFPSWRMDTASWLRSSQ